MINFVIIKHMKSIKVLFLCIIISSCSSIYVTQDFEKGTDFSIYKSYNYYHNLETGLSELDNKRLFYILDNQLQLQGFSHSEAPDFYINIYSSEFREAQRNTVGVGVGGSGSNVGGGVSVGIPIGQANISRQIVFEFVDENGIGLFWQAISESSYTTNTTPEKREAHLKSVVEKVFNKYPPKSN